VKLHFCDEPELEFGQGGRHVDIRFGLAAHGPLDGGLASAPSTIRVGLVGTQETVEGLRGWLTKCSTGIAAKISPLPNLFPSFPGYGTSSCFQSELVLSDSLTRTIAKSAVDDLARRAQTKDSAVVGDAVNLLYGEIAYLVEKGSVDIIVVAVPLDLVNLESEQDDDLASDLGLDESSLASLDLRQWLKAKTMSLGKPIQLVLPPTYDETKKRKLKTKNKDARALQDEATRAWNFHTALYYKAGGTPWRIIRAANMLSACHVGVSFYRTLQQSQLMTSMAQVYNERGEGIIVRGAPVRLSNDDPQPHLTADDSFQLLTNALDQYRREHKTLPARVTLHKTSSYSAQELDGFSRAVRTMQVDSADFLVVARSMTRLYRDGRYPPLRGTFLQLDDRNHVLYTKGSVDFYSTYPGLYVPRPLRFTCVQTEQTPHFLAQELMALTKLNWNNTQFDGGAPITIRVARSVGDVLKYVPEAQVIQPRYSFYM
jgi:hypothetical protein